ncbi:MAG: ACP S-malonyltransferase [Sulfurovum sp.]|nr:ACP S-malonyltransferase [Sulfurovum sp.]MCB4746856.1 ACP S-malonyltransferase [Sulfurovum sp.]MCB4748539.1 ACP S-malonyltransferase [Sulfurovum sp.]MCB4750706.1 ACP S-malonyltransferase [Sulfurovum sp.]MCB4754597.1 ACP S-malonyltransferase [Sulfurovum sp.]
MSVKCAFLFPGQGSQTVGMGEDFSHNSNIAKQMIADASEHTGIDFETLLFTENSNLEKTEFTQPAILLVSAIAHKLFENEMSIRPLFTLGHSLGEFSALMAVGALDTIDAIKLVNLRGKLMTQACEGQDVGMLVSLGLDDETVEKICTEQRELGMKVWPVNYNAQGQIVIAGAKPDLQKLEPILKKAKARRAMLLNMSIASHCPLLESATTPLVEKLKEVLKDEFIAPVVSNVTAETYNTKAEALKLLPKQLVSPVLYKQSITKFDNQIDCYVEFGHGGVLKGLNRKTTQKPHFVVSDMQSLANTIEEITKLK